MAPKIMAAMIYQVRFCFCWLMVTAIIHQGRGERKRGLGFQRSKNRCRFVVMIVVTGAAGFIGSALLGALLNHLKTPLMVAFSTTSSEAVFPKLTEELEKFGCRKKIVSFILPLGYSFNLDGSMMYMTFASIFIAQAYGIPLDLGTQLTMLLVLMLTSKGIAGVPRASLVVVAATCAMFDIPAEGIALILPIDHFCDMGRSMTNVLGNGLATAAVDKWEKD